MTNQLIASKSRLMSFWLFVACLFFENIACWETKRDDNNEFSGAYSLHYKTFSIFVDSDRDGMPYQSFDDFDIDTVMLHNSKPLILLRWEHEPEGRTDTVSNTTLDRNLQSVLLGLGLWMSRTESAITLTPDSKFRDFCEDCSLNKICGPQFYCLMKLGPPRLFRDPGATGTNVVVGPFRDCLSERYGFNRSKVDPSTWVCQIALTSTSFRFEGLAPDQTLPCNGREFDLTSENWKNKQVNGHLRRALQGGVDTDGVFWEGRQGIEPIAQTIGRQFWLQRGEQCTIKQPCQPELSCERIGSFAGLALGTLGRPIKIPWVLLASSAVKNLNQQLGNTYEQVLDAIESLAFDAFSIDEFSPQPDPKTDVTDTLAGLGSIFTLLGGLIPGGQVVEAVGTITSGVGSLIGNAAPRDLLAPQKSFATNVLAYYKGLRDGLENFTTNLFAGEQIPGPRGNFNLSDMIRGGAWVSKTAITDVSKLNENIRTEVTARCIDALWKTWSSNKMWVLFTDLQDDEKGTKCNSGQSV